MPRIRPRQSYGARHRPAPGSARPRLVAAVLQLLDLKQRRRARDAARQARRDGDALAGLAPAELDDAIAGVRDQLLGDVVAADVRRLDAPHEPAAAHRLAPRRERED